MNRVYPREYASWAAMKARCDNPNNGSYEDYGARGITYCRDWRYFSKFIKSMGVKPTAKHTLERIDNDGNYEPDNCKWATRKEQAINRSHCGIKLSYMCREQYIKDWASELGMTEGLIRCRLKRGWPVEEALNPKLRKKPNGTL